MLVSFSLEPFVRIKVMYNNLGLIIGPIWYIHKKYDQKAAISSLDVIIGEWRQVENCYSHETVVRFWSVLIYKYINYSEA